MLCLKSLGMKRLSCQLIDAPAVLSLTASKPLSSGHNSVVAIGQVAIVICSVVNVSGAESIVFGDSSKSVGESAIVIGSSAIPGRLRPEDFSR